MAYNKTKPTINADTSPMGGDIYSHPAYGIATVHAITGDTTLFGSDLGHHGAIRIEVKRAKLHRSLGRDWFGGEEILCTFDMSHAQFAQFITSQNQGSGTPVTLIHAAPKGAGIEIIDGIENLQSKHDLHRDEIRRSAREQIDNIMGLLKSLNDLAESGTIPKKQLKALLFSIKCHVDNLPGNLEYSVKSAEEALEKATSDAKIEVESYCQLTINRLGLQYLNNELPKYEQLSSPEPLDGDSAE